MLDHADDIRVHTWQHDLVHADNINQGYTYALKDTCTGIPGNEYPGSGLICPLCGRLLLLGTRQDESGPISSKLT